MNTFKTQCINYLLVREWMCGEGDYEYQYLQLDHGYRVYTDDLAAALYYQLMWDDEGD